MRQYPWEGNSKNPEPEHNRVRAKTSLDRNCQGVRRRLPNQELLLGFRSEREVFNIKPGITGLAQVMGYDMSNPKKLSEVDELYVRNKSLKIDALILIATFINSPKKYLAQHFKIEDVSSIK